MTVEVIPLRGVPEVEPGDDLAALLEAPLRSIPAADGDVVAITQKVVSKAEGRLVRADERARAIDDESVAVVARRGEVVIVRTRHGFVCANAGIDASNVPDGWLTLLPEDPDGSAERLKKELADRLGLARLAVVITDTFGRPWREGVLDVAIGCAGLPPLLDLRGTPDDRGRTLDSTVVAFADAVAAASGLVMQKAARVPAALVRGVIALTGDAPPGPARAIVRRAEDDLFRESALISSAAAGPIERLEPGAVRREDLEEAVRAAAEHDPSILVAVTSAAALRRLRRAAPGHRSLRVGGAAVVVCAPGSVGSSALRAGAAIGALGSTLRATGMAWSWDPDAELDRAAVVAALELGEDARPIAILAIGPRREGGAA